MARAGMACADANTLVAFAAGDLPTDRRQQLAAHVDTCARCSASVAAAAAELERGADSRTQTRPRADHPDPGLERGATIDRFVILDRVGAGGLGTVYAAYDPDLDRRIAIKVLHPDPGQQRLAEPRRQRLVREARALAQVSHPNVVPIHELGTVGDRLFIAMELVDGTTLREWLRVATRTWTEIRDVFVDAARGLAAVHAAALVHRDVKPSNIVVGSDGRARILDFGLAGPTPRDANDGAGVLMGTPAYMAPEQYLSSTVDARADQFGLSVALYEALVGTRPFGADAIRAATHAGQLPAPDTGHATPKGPKWLHGVVRRGLSADPASRFASMDALAQALQADRRTRRRRRLAIASTVVAAAAGAAALTVALVPGPTPQERSVVTQLTDEAHRAAARNFFVYPPAEQPELRTAYIVVELLSALDGRADQEAQRAAEELRREFAETLVRLGDRYWGEDGGRGFASDYYIQALLFDPRHARARERALVLPGQLGAIAEAARAADFSDAELAAAEPLVALADENPGRRRDRVRKLARLGETTRARLRKLVDDPDTAAPTPEPRTTPTKAGVQTRPPAPLPAPARDPAAARALAKKGRAALRARKLTDAARSFSQALAADSRHIPALTGLAETHFEQGELGTAVRIAEKAARLAPRNAAVQLLLGDMYRKVRRYDAARATYKRAEELGHRHARAKLRHLDNTVGNPRG